MLQVHKRICRTLLPLAWAVVSAGGAHGTDAPAAAPPATLTIPLTVCEVLRDLPAEAGKNVAVLGRYSYRENGNWVSEDTCDPALSAAPRPAPAQLVMVEDHTAPKLPDDYELDRQAVQRKLAEVQRHTTLAKFRFGTPDYDRWAVILGRVELRKGDEAGKAAANLLYRGTGVIFFLTQ